MKVKISQLNPCRKLLKIEVPQETVKKELDNIYKEIGKVAEISGFRKGKVPRNVLEQYHSQAAKDEVLKKLIPATYSEAIRQNDIFPVSMPEINQVKLVDDQPLYFEAAVDIKPDFNLKKYKGFKIKKKKIEFKEEEVDNALSLLRERVAEYKTVDNREIKEGDYVIADYECNVDNKTAEKKEKAWFFINKDDKNQLKDIIDKLRGAKIGQEMEIKTTLPKDYLKVDLAGKDALFKIKVKEIKEKKLPDLDEKFVKNFGDYKSLDELKEALRKDINLKKENEVKVEAERQLSDNLLESNPLDVPLSMIKEQTEELINSMKARLLYQGLKEEDLKAQEENLRKGMEKEAEKQIKLYFILNAIADKEDIKCDGEDLGARLKEIAKQNKSTPEKIKEYLTKNNSLDSLKGQIHQEKTMEYLLKENTV